MKLRHAAIAVSIVAVVALFAYARNQDPGAKASPAPSQAPPAAVTASSAAADEPKILYALGVLLGQNVRILNLTPAELEQVKLGLTDAATGKKPDVDLQAYGPKLQQFGAARIKAVGEQEKVRGQAYHDAAAKEAGAVLAPSGLVFKELTPGTGRNPSPTDTVRVHYRGTLIDGTEFDSSITRGQPAEFPLNGVIPCWTEGVQRLKVGGKARLVCPSSIAYGDQGRPPAIPGGATLVFEVELLDIKAPSPAAAAPGAGASPAAAATPRPAATAHPAASPKPAMSPSPSPTPTPEPKH